MTIKSKINEIDLDPLFSEDDMKIKPSHRDYENEYEIIENREQFNSKVISHKYKIAWLNERNRLCLRSFILLGYDRENKENYVSIDVINGIKQDEIKVIKHYSEIFNNNTLVFVGYIPDNDFIISKIKLKQKNNV